jgi:hypothetical protein
MSCDFKIDRCSYQMQRVKISWAELHRNIIIKVLIYQFCQGICQTMDKEKKDIDPLSEFHKAVDLTVDTNYE